MLGQLFYEIETNLAHGFDGIYCKADTPRPFRLIP
jgi:hypothetical protein